MNDSTVSDEKKAEALDKVRATQKRAIEVNEDNLKITKNALLLSFKQESGKTESVEKILELIRSGYKVNEKYNGLLKEIKDTEKEIDDTNDLIHQNFTDS
jgi:hypothetical protein